MRINIDGHGYSMTTSYGAKTSDGSTIAANSYARKVNGFTLT